MRVRVRACVKWNCIPVQFGISMTDLATGVSSGMTVSSRGGGVEGGDGEGDGMWLWVLVGQRVSKMVMGSKGG